MKSIETIFNELDKNGDLNVIRCDIADLIIQQLERSKTLNNVAALSHLTNAVGTLNLNVHSSRQPSTAGLEICLKDLQKAIETIDRNERRFNLRIKRVEQVTYDMLIEAVRTIREISSCDSANDQHAA
jgi:hypothetical protein